MQTTADLIDSTKLNGAIPDNTDQWGDTNILKFATEIMNEILLPHMLRVKKEYFKFNHEVPIIGGKSKYRVHARAAFGILRDVYWLQSDGVSRQPVPQMDSIDAKATAPGTIRGFYMESNSVVLYQTPSQDYGFLGMPFYIRPSALIVASLAARVTAIDTLTNTLTISGFPSTGFTIGAGMDFVKGTPGYEIIQIDNIILGTDPSPGVLTLTMTDPISSDVEVGDWVSPAGYSPVPNIPEEFHSIVALATAARYLGSIGQLDQQKGVDNQIDKHLASMNLSMVPRVAGQSLKLTTQLI